MELEKLLVKIEADLSGLKKGLSEAQKQIKGSSSGFEKSFTKANASIDKFSSTAMKVGGILAVAFGAIQIKNVAKVGMEIENLTVRLQALFGSAEEGSRAFQTMVGFASRVPFTLQEIQRGSGSLAVVSGDAEELGGLLEITGNIAAVTGLDFKMASEQIQRSLSSGIASADMFRERGVTAMLGFQQGATVSVEETEKKLREVFGKGGKFGNAADELAKTLTGTLSMIGDKFFKVQTAISDGFFDELKAELREFDRALARNETTIAAYGRVIGQSIGDAISGIANNISGIMTGLKMFAAFIFGTFLSAKLIAGFIAIKDVLKKINAGLKTTVVLNAALSGGFIGLALRIGGAVAAYVTMEKALEGMNEDVIEQNKLLIEQEKMEKAIAKVYDLRIRGAKGLRDQTKDLMTMTKEQKKLFKELNEVTVEFKDIFDDAGQSISDAFGDAIAKGQDFKTAMVGIFQNVISQVTSLIVQLLIVEPILRRIRGAIDDARQSAARSGGGILDVILGGLGNIITGQGASTPSTVPDEPFSGMSLSGRASGGFVAPGVAYTVGEQGAETFIPRTAGTIIPNGGGGVNVTQNISFSTGVVPTVRAEVMNLLPVIKQQTVSAVAEQRSRGGAFAKTFGA